MTSTTLMHQAGALKTAATPLPVWVDYLPITGDLCLDPHRTTYPRSS
jgi:hypothetical protein